MEDDDAVVGVGMLGCGNVGSALIRLIDDHGDTIEARAGVRLEVVAVAVRDVARDRDVPLPAARFTDDPAAVVGRPVVTANKELLADVGKELFDSAEAAGVDLLFEASVAGGIPLIRPLRESLAGDRIRRVTGIVNGTTNYVLTRMTDDGSPLAEALASAQELGYAEADPTADVEGYDAAAKAAIIAMIAFGARVVAGDVHREGISGVGAADIAAAADLGYVVKLLAVAEEIDGAVAVRVHPTMVPVRHPLASVRDSFNAVSYTHLDVYKRQGCKRRTVGRLPARDYPPRPRDGAPRRRGRGRGRRGRRRHRGRRRRAGGCAVITPDPFDRTLVPPGLLALDLEELAGRFGTPLFVYDEEHLRARCREYLSHFGSGNVAYASKAFLCTAMARLVDEEGLNLDVATGGELAVALHAGFPPSRVVVHGNNKSDGEVTAALGAGVGTVVVDSHDELDRLDRAVAVGGVAPRVLVRVTPGVEAHTHEFIETGTERSKFGFSISTGAALDAVRRVASSHLTVAGLHCHICLLYTSRCV